MNYVFVFNIACLEGDRLYDVSTQHKDKKRPYNDGKYRRYANWNANLSHLILFIFESFYCGITCIEYSE